MSAVPVSSQSDQSSNSSGCSQGASFRYLPAGSQLVSVSAGSNLGSGFNDMSPLLSASGNSLLSGGRSVIYGNSNLRGIVTMNGDSVASSGATPVGMPTSPLSFTSSNACFPGSSGLPMSQSAVTPRNNIDAQLGPNMQPAKLLKIEPSQQLGEELRRQGSQLVSNGQQLTRFGGQGVPSAEHLQQNLSPLSPSMSGAQSLRNHLILQHQARQGVFQRPCATFSPQMQHQEALQQQPQLMQAQILQQQRLLQQEQILRGLPSQLHRSHILQKPQQIQQIQEQIAGLVRQSPNTISGAFTRRIMQYMQHQRMRPPDNNLGFWRELVSEYFTSKARKRWCLSQCTAGGVRQSAGVFPQELWRCEVCRSSPSRGFEVAVDVMPRLCKTKVDTGELEELLYVDLPREYKLSSGLTVLEYGRAIQESVFENLRIVWDGQLRLIFTQELKILSWDFCVKSHEELFPRRSVIPQVNQLLMLASKYQTIGNGNSVQDLQAIWNMFVSAIRQLGKSLDPPYVNELGFTKRFVRCIQIAEVVSSMKDLMDFSHENGIGPIESLQKYPCYTGLVQGSNMLMQPEPLALAQYLAAPNSIFLNSRLGKQANSLGRATNGQASTLPPLQSYPQRNSYSYMQSDPLAMGAVSCGSLSMQASPTSSLTSLQSSLTSLNPNQQVLQSSMSGSLGTSYEAALQDGQCKQLNLVNPIQQHLQDLRDRQLTRGGLLHSFSSSNDIGNASGGIMSGDMTDDIGGIEGLPDNFVSEIGGGTGINMGIQHSNASLAQVGNSGAVMQGMAFGLQMESQEFEAGELGNHVFDWK